MTVEQRAHDLAIAFTQYKLNIEAQNSDADHDETVFFEMYKTSHDRFYEMLTEGI